MTVILLPRQSAGGNLEDIRGTLSSWDRCMSKAYCKWPVITALISAGFIVLIILWCVVGCVCFGTACCWGCCGCCGSGRGGRRRRRRDDRSKSLDAHASPPDYGNGYAPAPLSSPRASGHSSRPAHRVNDDALPPMPTWQTAQERRIFEERKTQGADVELGPLHASAPMNSAVDQHVHAQPMPHAPPIYEPNPYSYNGAGGGAQNVGYQAAANVPYQQHHQQQYQYPPQLQTEFAAGPNYDSHRDVVSPVSPSSYSHSPYLSPIHEPQSYSHATSKPAPTWPSSAPAPASAQTGARSGGYSSPARTGASGHGRHLGSYHHQHHGDGSGGTTSHDGGASAVV